MPARPTWRSVFMAKWNARTQVLPLWAVLLMAGSPAGAAEPDAAAAEFFEKQVRPLLAEHCLKCHGGDKTKGGLELTSRANVLEGGDSGPAAVAGQPEKSLLVQAIRYEGETKMPPTGKLPP